MPCAAHLTVLTTPWRLAQGEQAGSGERKSSLMAQVVKNPPATQETWIQSLGREDPLEKEMTTHSSILAWRIPWIENPGGLQPIGSQRVGHD